MRFGFLVNEVLTGLRRNVTMTVAMILTTAISIGLFGGGLLVIRLADSSRAIYLDRVESQVFLMDDVSANDPNCDADPCQALRKTIDDRNDVKSVRFLSHDDAYTDALKKFPQFKDIGVSRNTFPASFIVKLNDAENHKEFDAAMKNLPGVENEYAMPPVVDALPQVQVSTMGSWKEVGTWFWNLAKEQVDVNDSMRNDIARANAEAIWRSVTCPRSISA